MIAAPEPGGSGEPLTGLKIVYCDTGGYRQQGGLSITLEGREDYGELGLSITLDSGEDYGERGNLLLLAI